MTAPHSLLTFEQFPHYDLWIGIFTFGAAFIGFMMYRSRTVMEPRPTRMRLALISAAPFLTILGLMIALFILPTSGVITWLHSV